jgi:hypothetical protein
MSFIWIFHCFDNSLYFCSIEKCKKQGSYLFLERIVATPETKIEIQNSQINGPMYEITGNEKVNIKAPNNG